MFGFILFIHFVCFKSSLIFNLFDFIFFMVSIAVYLTWSNVNVHYFYELQYLLTTVINIVPGVTKTIMSNVLM